MSEKSCSDYFCPLEGPVRSRKFLVLDVESKDGPTQRAGFTRPFMVGVYDGQTYWPFFDSQHGGNWEERYWWDGGCVDLAMRHILRKCYRGWHVYAHNAGKFDYLFILPWLMHAGDRLGYMFSLIPVASTIQVLDVWRPRFRPAAPGQTLGQDRGEKKFRNNVWRFLDSYRLMPIGLDRAAKAFGLQGKLKHDLELPETDPRWVAYNRTDCEELYQVVARMHHYVENVLLGEVGITAPATSMKLLRRRYLKHGLPRSKDTHEFVRRGYYGGRVEVFCAQGKGLSYFDINSSYPRAMLEPMPGGKATWWQGVPPERFRRNYLGFVEADVTVPINLHIPPLPVHVAADTVCEGESVPKGKLLFPVGKLSGVWEWSELQLAFELGCTIEHWKQSVWYKPVELFTEFVLDLYQYRDSSRPGYDRGLAEVVKRLLNACYGKFGMRTLRKKIYRFDDPDLPEDALPAMPTPESPIWYAETEVDAPYIMPQIAARVTALARVQLYRAMQRAERAGGVVYYCDTDSVITDATLKTSSELGELKNEYPEHAGLLTGEFVGPKLYLLWCGACADTTEPCSACRAVAEQVARERGEPAKLRKLDLVKAKGLQERTRENVERLARGETILQKRLEKVGSLARAGFLRGPRLLLVPRKHHLHDGKRKQLEDGTTRPYRVKMW